MRKMKNLVIVESPSKSKTIGKYLGKDYTVVSSKGHIRDLATSGVGGLGVDVEKNFEATYKVSKDKKDTVKELKKLASESDFVYLATDPDREGEAISWHLAQELGLSEDLVDRVTFHEITKNAVQEAFKQPRTLDMNLVHSQETRRILDRIIGFKLSKLLNSKIKSKSAGRVQSVALKLIVEKEKEIKAFVPEEYWEVEAAFKKKNRKFNAKLSKVDGKKADLKNEEDAMRVINGTKGEFTVSNIKKSKTSNKAPFPFITSTLQQEASTKLGFSARRTMSIAQGLYEGVDVGNGQEGLITYMRTDSTRLSNVYVFAARDHIEKEYGKEYLGFYKVKNDDGAQDAHEAIRPTNIAYTPDSIKSYLTNDQYKLYKFIYYRALASQMAASKSDKVTVTLSQNEFDFTANGNVLSFDGYLKAYGDYVSNKDTILPEFEEGEKLNAESVTPTQHFTEPPKRYTEASLIKKLEEDGIGRPSTYAMIIDTIQARGYVTLAPVAEKSRTKFFTPTEQGILTTDKLDQYFSSIINVSYTRDMESELDEIAEGTREEVPTLRSFYDKFTPLLDTAYEKMEKIAPEKVGEVCPDCGGELVYRNSRYGKFISCSNFPKRKSRFGTYFLGCSGFPKCHYMENLEGERIVSKKDKAASKKTTKKTTKKKTTTKKSSKKVEE